MDKLVTYINQNTSVSGVQVQYSTLNDYFTAVANAKVDWEVVGPRDYFPYIGKHIAVQQKRWHSRSLFAQKYHVFLDPSLESDSLVDAVSSLIY